MSDITSFEFEFNDEETRRNVRDHLKMWFDLIRQTETLPSPGVKYILPEGDQEQALIDLRKMIDPAPSDEQWEHLCKVALAGDMYLTDVETQPSETDGLLSVRFTITYDSWNKENDHATD